MPPAAARTRWQTAGEAIHEKKHGHASIEIGSALCASPVDAQHPGFIDPRSGDIYRFDVKNRHMAITTAGGDIKSCYPKSEVDFRRAALIAEQNRSSMTYEQLGATTSSRSTPDHARRRTLRDDIFDLARRNGIPL